MRVMHWRFGGLFWRLTMSYLAITLIAALVIEFAITILPVLRDIQQTNVSPLQTLEKRGVALTAPSIDHILTNKDEDSLRYALAIPLFDEIAQEEPQLTFVALLDHTGHPLTSATCTRSQLLSLGTRECAQRTQRKLAQLQADTVAQHAFTQSTSNSASTSLIQNLPTGESLITIPVQDPAKQTTITLLVSISAPLTTQNNARTIQPQQVLTTLWSYWQPAGFYFIFLSTALGTGAGMLISLHLTRRLRKIAHATKEWSQGEFQSAIHDQSYDEIGQLSRDLNTMAEQLQMLLLTRRKLAIVEERSRLKRDLHDSVKQHLFAMQMQLSAVRVLFQKDIATSHGHLVEAEKLAVLAQQELANLIEELRPAALSDKNLVMAIKEFCHDWSQRTGIEIYVHTDHGHAHTAELEQALFRVTQEALSNVARHSGARHVYVKLLDEAEALTLSIADDGHGFSLSHEHRQKHSIGLQNMRERIEALHGLFTLESTRNGTYIKAHIPLPTKEKKT